MKNIPWKCPVCGGALCLSADQKTLSCEKRHSFDLARQGYVHLLLPQKRGAVHPGDSADMVRARTEFLSTGSYAGFSDGINAVCLDLLKEIGTPSPLFADAGCGEGYYTLRLLSHLRAQDVDARGVGFDLSKEAVLHGAKEARAAGLSAQLSYAVSSLFEMPLSDGCADLILNLFAPAAPAEFARVLSPGGYLIMAVPAARHLYGLKEVLYDAPYENEERRDVLEGFTLLKVHRIAYEITLDRQEDMENLFLMTPYYWKTSKKDHEKLSHCEVLRTPVEFDLLIYKKAMFS